MADKEEKKETKNTTKKKDKNTEVAVSKPQQVVPVAVPTAEGLISQAISQGLDADTMAKFMDMRRELKAEAAKEAFDNAMAGFQSECPVIEKKKSADDKTGKSMYKYAPLDSIVQQTKELIARNGLSYTFRTKNEKEVVTVTCIVKHSLGHSEESEMSTTLANKTGIMSAPQQIAATVTFNKRYAFCNAFGIMTGDEDTDAQGVDDDAEKQQELVEQQTKALENCKTLEQLSATWEACDKRIPQVLEAKNKMKAKLKHGDRDGADKLNVVDETSEIDAEDIDVIDVEVA